MATCQHMEQTVMQTRLVAQTPPSTDSALGRQCWSGSSCQEGHRREMEQSPPDTERPRWLDFSCAPAAFSLCSSAAGRAFMETGKISKFSHCCSRSFVFLPSLILFWGLVCFLGGFLYYYLFGVF